MGGVELAAPPGSGLLLLLLNGLPPVRDGDGACMMPAAAAPLSLAAGVVLLLLHHLGGLLELFQPSVPPRSWLSPCAAVAVVGGKRVSVMLAWCVEITSPNAKALLRSFSF